jgi:hypothetical protein
MTAVRKTFNPLLTCTLVGLALGGVIPAVAAFVYIEWTRPNDPEIPDVNGLAVIVSGCYLILGGTTGSLLGLIVGAVWATIFRRRKGEEASRTEGERTDESPRLPPGWRDLAPRSPPDRSGIEKAPP